MTIPREYGGHGRTFLERFIVNEELLAAGAPMGAHWIADRQTAPQLLRYGTERQKAEYLPKIAAGELFVAAGMSEPDSGSDLASLRTQARRVRKGWVLNGTKVWSSHAHHCHVMVALVRTSPRSDDRHEGLSQLVVDLDAPGVHISPIRTMAGTDHFAEVVFEDVFVSEDMLLGREGEGWSQVRSELAFERSGPERFLSTYPLLRAALVDAGDAADGSALDELGEVTASMWALRVLSEELNRSIEEGNPEPARAALVKNAGTLLEGDIVETSRHLLRHSSSSSALTLLRDASLIQPAFTLRGGTNEVLKTIVAKAWSR